MCRPGRTHAGPPLRQGMYISGKHLSRRAVLKGLGATVALPFLDAMAPAGRGLCADERKIRLICVDMVHGSAGSSLIGARKNLLAPAGAGRDFDLTPTSLRSLAPFRDALTIVSNTDWSSAVFLTQAHPRQTNGADVQAGVSLDQLYAQRFGQTTPIPSMQLCIETGDQGGGCGYGYSCAYTDTISWASPTRPLPMVRDPRVVFDTLFGVLGNGSAQERRERRQEDLSILDWVRESSKRLERRLGAADRVRLGDYLDNVREIERRLQAVERRNDSGEPRELPMAPRGVPDS